MIIVIRLRLSMLETIIIFFKAAKMAKKRKMPHGGRREGAGRPPMNPDEKARVVAVTVPGELADRLDAYAAKMSWNRSQAVTEAIRGLLDAKR